MKNSADELLKDAMRHWDNADKGGAKYYCDQILKLYPDTDAARSAQEILDGLPSSRSVDSNTPSRPAGDSQTRSAKYSTGRGIAAFVGFLGWIVVIVGSLVMIFAAVQGLGVFGVLSGIGITIAGFLQIMGAQLVTAPLDKAEHTGEMLAIMKEDNN